MDKTGKDMLRVVRGSLSLLFLLHFCPLTSQSPADLSYLEIKDEAEERYGPSADLFNGEKYYYPYRGAGGDPFFEVGDNHPASIQIKGKLYENQTVRYDICNQLMVLDFMDPSGAKGSIVLRNEWLDFLILGGTHFKVFQDENGTERFGQVIFEDTFSCVYFWNKKYLPDLHLGENRYFFSEPIRETSIVVHGQSIPYTGNRSFLKCFSSQETGHIKKYLKENRIRVNRATDLEMQSLMEYINHLSGDDE